MRTKKLEIACPVCSSIDVFYTCTPNCCFNHVCNNCGSTFEPVTAKAGGAVSGAEAPDPLPEASDPTVACVRCEDTTVYMLEDKSLVCTNCGTRLTLEFTEIARG